MPVYPVPRPRVRTEASGPLRPRLRWRGTGVALALAAATVAAGCSSTSTRHDASSNEAHAKSTTTTTDALTPITTPTVLVNGTPVSVPQNQPNTPISPAVSSGQNIIISDQGVLPARLFSFLDQPVVFTNLTDHTVSVTFSHANVRSGPIPPGKTWSWTTKTLVTVAYRVSNGYVGLIVAGAFETG